MVLIPEVRVRVPPVLLWDSSLMAECSSSYISSTPCRHLKFQTNAEGTTFHPEGCGFEPRPVSLEAVAQLDRASGKRFFNSLSSVLLCNECLVELHFLNKYSISPLNLSLLFKLRTREGLVLNAGSDYI
jgi:hypothetical protein